MASEGGGASATTPPPPSVDRKAMPRFLQTDAGTDGSVSAASLTTVAKAATRVVKIADPKSGKNHIIVHMAEGERLAVMGIAEAWVCHGAVTALGFDILASPTPTFVKVNAAPNGSVLSFVVRRAGQWPRALLTSRHCGLGTRSSRSRSPPRSRRGRAPDPRASSPGVPGRRGTLRDGSRDGLTP